MIVRVSHEYVHKHCNSCIERLYQLLDTDGNIVGMHCCEWRDTLPDKCKDRLCRQKWGDE